MSKLSKNELHAALIKLYLDLLKLGVLDVSLDDDISHYDLRLGILVSNFKKYRDDVLDTFDGDGINMEAYDIIEEANKLVNDSLSVRYCLSDGTDYLVYFNIDRNIDSIEFSVEDGIDRSDDLISYDTYDKAEALKNLIFWHKKVDLEIVKIIEVDYEIMFESIQDKEKE